MTVFLFLAWNSTPLVYILKGRSESEVSGTGRDSEHLPSEGDEKPSIINPGILESENVKPETTIDTITVSCHEQSIKVFEITNTSIPFVF